MTITETAKQYYRDMRRKWHPRSGLPDHVGYAPADWTGLLRHLLGQGFTESEAVESGLCIRNGRHVYDRHRDTFVDLSGEYIKPHVPHP